jgi:hypothetical protein
LCGDASHGQVLRTELEQVEGQVAVQRDALAKTKRSRDKIRAENDRCGRAV